MLPPPSGRPSPPGHTVVSGSRSCRAGKAAGQGKRFFVSRGQPKTGLLTRSGHRITLHGVLPQQEGQRIEFGALLGIVGRLPVRVLIERVRKEVADERRAHPQ